MRGGRSASFIIRRLISTAPNDTALSAKQMPSPTSAISTPAIVGPMMRAMLNIIELSEIAWRRSSRPTMSSVMDWRDGMSKELIRPMVSARQMISQTCTVPVSVSTARTAACSIAALCVKSRNFRRSTRSATMPPNGVMRNTGTVEQNDVTPSSTRGMGQAVDQPGLRRVLHPRAHQRDELAGEEQAVVAMTEDVDQTGAVRMGEFGDFLLGWRLVRRRADEVFRLDAHVR